MHDNSWLHISHIGPENTPFRRLLFATLLIAAADTAIIITPYSRLTLIIDDISLRRFRQSRCWLPRAPEKHGDEAPPSAVISPPCPDTPPMRQPHTFRQVILIADASFDTIDYAID
jgi:hypothetical protein